MKKILNFILLCTIAIYTKAGDDFNLLSLGNGTQPSGINSGNYFGDPIKFKNKLLLSRSDGNTGYELWISDGTTLGTKLLKDIVPGSEGSYPHDFINRNNEVIFTVATKDELTGNLIYELWKTDGTESGTQFIDTVFKFFSIEYPNESGFQKRFFLVGSFDNKIIYKYNNDYTPTTGWHTLALNYTSNSIEHFPLNNDTFKIDNGIQIGNKFLFSNKFPYGPFAQTALEYYITDGTNEGTTLLKNENTPLLNGFWSNYTWDNTLYFYGADSNFVSAIFKVNTETNQIEKVLPIMDNYNTNEAGLTTVKFSTANNKLIIHLLFKKNKNDFISDIDSSAIFISDGTITGTNKIEILNNKIRFLIDKLPNEAFLCKDFENNIKAFNFSNNTFGETIDDTQNNEWNDNFIAFNTNQYYVKNNNCYMIRGNKILKTNGTKSGTTIIDELNIGYSNLADSWFTFEANNKLCFIVIDDYRIIQNLWYIDLTNDKISTLGNYESYYYPALNPYLDFDSKNYITYQNKTYFSGFNNYGQVAWKTEGTASTTIPIGQKLTGQAPFIDQHFGWFGAFDKMYYGTYDDYNTLFVTNGNETTKLDSFNIEVPYGINRFYQYNNEVYFVANDKTICKTNGTKAGTKRLKTITGKGVIGDFFEINGSLYIPAIGNNKEFIWKINTDGTLTPIIKWNTLPFTFNTGQVVTFFGVLNGKNIFEVCDEISEQTGEHLGKHHLLAFDGTKVYLLSNPTQTTSFKTKYAYFNNFVIKENKLFFTTIGLTDGTKPVANFSNIGRDFTEDGYLFYTQGQEGDLIQAKEFQEFQANIQCIEVLGIKSISRNIVQLKSKYNQIYTTLYNSLYPTSFDALLKSLFILKDDFEFEKTLDLEDEMDDMLINISKIYFSEDSKIYGIKTFANQTYTEMKTIVSSCNGLSINSEVKYDTITSSNPSFLYGIEDENIGIYKDKLYFLIKPIGINLNGAERILEIDLASKASRVVPIPAYFSKIKDINFNRNDGILVTAYYTPTQIERPGTSLWLYNNTTTGINHNLLKAQLSLFPNPTKNIVMIKIPNDFLPKTIELFNLNGVLIEASELNLDSKNQTIDVSNYPNGTYLIRINNETQSLTGKFIKID
jgi:ELWxxDGT repeat protein